jgi:hypothetical protein
VGELKFSLKIVTGGVDAKEAANDCIPPSQILTDEGTIVIAGGNGLTVTVKEITEVHKLPVDCEAVKL